VAFTPDGHALLSGALDDTIKVWNVATGQLNAEFDWNVGRITALAFAPGGVTAAAAGSDHNIVVWDVDY
jgi:WD40 repeat protein